METLFVYQQHDITRLGGWGVRAGGGIARRRGRSIGASWTVFPFNGQQLVARNAVTLPNMSTEMAHGVDNSLVL